MCVLLRTHLSKQQHFNRAAYEAFRPNESERIIPVEHPQVLQTIRLPRSILLFSQMLLIWYSDQSEDPQLLRQTQQCIQSLHTDSRTSMKFECGQPALQLRSVDRLQPIRELNEPRVYDGCDANKGHIIQLGHTKPDQLHQLIPTFRTGIVLNNADEKMLHVRLPMLEPFRHFTFRDTIESQVKGQTKHLDQLLIITSPKFSPSLIQHIVRERVVFFIRSVQSEGGELLPFESFEYWPDILPLVRLPRRHHIHITFFEPGQLLDDFDHEICPRSLLVSERRNSSRVIKDVF
ncbi:hypothetical protein BT69DRAFT_926456 [Atractiella rhizophila]|nr:hypothetical protein BT69DRAFT_926456 [Atractiella rhizophila]